MTAIDKQTQQESPKKGNIEPIVSEVSMENSQDTGAIKSAAFEDPAPSGITNTGETEAPHFQTTENKTSEDVPVSDRFWRGVFNGVGLALLLGGIPILFGVNLSLNQNSSLYQAKVDLAQLQLTQLNNNSKTLQSRLIDIAGNESVITTLIAEKEVELNALQAEREAISNQLKYNELERQMLNSRLDTINSEAEKPFFAENLPALPKLPTTD